MKHKIFEIPIEQEVQDSYIDYAMSVIVSRALPDVRDGLKPVHRRILYAMLKLGLKSSAKFRKSATVVGEVLGKYHPHGDTSVYDALVRLAQDFSLRYPLIFGQGNFGSIDGDPQAAMRYTEAKLSKIAEEMLYDIEKQTVNFRDNYDGSQKEPEVLPSKLPNLIINGTMGIAVGMATNIPPHNLTEVCNALIYLIDNKDATIEDLMKFIKGPDFPTGGIIFNKQDIKNVYSTGKGGIVIRAKAEIEDIKDASKIVITEIPYQVNKSQLLEKIANLVKEKKIEGIKELKDATDKEGLRIIIGLKKDSNPKKILALLYKYTQMQTVFYSNFVALVDGIQPKILNLKGILEEYIKHREKVITRRTKYELSIAEKRAHILEGLKKALDIIDKVIDTIRSSKNREDAKINLMKKFKFTEIQTDAILDMRLHQLANLERTKVLEELKEKLELIKNLKKVLASKRKVLEIIKKDLEYLKNTYGDERRTKVIESRIEEISETDLILDEQIIILVTNRGYIKRVSPNVFKAQARGGKGVKGVEIQEGDFVKEVIFTNTKNDLLFFTSKGKVYKEKAFNIPEGSRISKGKFIANILSISGDEKISAIISIDKSKSLDYLFMSTKNGLVKKVKAKDFENIRSTGIIAIKLKKGDDLKFVSGISKEMIVCLVTKKGKIICFNHKDVRPMGRNATGVLGIRISKDDEIIGIGVCEKKEINQAELLTVTEKGYGKRSKLKEYTIQKRGGKGIKACKITKKTGDLIYSLIVTNKKLQTIKGDLMLVSNIGKVIRVKFDTIPVLSRTTIGVKIMKLGIGKISSATLV